MKSEKVLFLTLGTGNNEYQRLSDEFTSKAYDKKMVFEAYQLARYRFEDGEEIAADFIGYPLIRKLMPDKVFVVGTVKSVWTALYSKFVPDEKRSYVDMKTLLSIEKNSDNTSLDEKIIEAQNCIQEIFDRSDLALSLGV